MSATALGAVEALDFPFALKSVATARDARGAVGVFEGLASTFGERDRAGDMVLPGAFARVRPERVRLLWQHRPDRPIGVFDEISETARGLFVRGRLVLEVQQAREAHALLKAGAIDALSIGFTVPADGMEYDRATGIRKLKRLELWEVSIVTFPANDAARIRRVKDVTAADLATELRRLARFVAGAASAPPGHRSRQHPTR